MPPLRRLVLHDPVDNLIKRLPSHFQSMLEVPQDVTATNNALRLLATKAPVGTWGAHDRPESRAAVLLEYVVRTREAASVGGGTTKNQSHSQQMANNLNSDQIRILR